MHFQVINIQNFRRFEQFECAFDPHFTLLMGANGTGKTSLLKGIWCGLSPIGVVLNLNLPGLQDEDVKCSPSIDASDESWLEAQYPCAVDLKVLLDELSLLFNEPDSKNFSVEKLRAGPLRNEMLLEESHFQASFSQEWLDPTRTTPIPLLARIDATRPQGNDSPREVGKPFESKHSILALAAQGESNIQNLAQWFQYNELRRLQEGKSPLIYDEVKKAVLSAIHAEDILYVARENALMVRHADVGLRSFNQLSDGQIRIASIFCDLAMRCASLNSHLGAGSIAKTPGLVTIDELDLHLHPKWQQQVVGDLRRVFPLLQFIVTSHSPFLLQAAFEHGSVVDMATGQFVTPSDPSIEDIAEGTMGVVLPQRGQRFQEMKAAAMAYYALLEQVPTATPEAKAAIKQKLDDALIPYANDPAYAAFLEMHRAVAGV